MPKRNANTRLSLAQSRSRSSNKATKQRRPDNNPSTVAAVKERDPIGSRHQTKTRFKHHRKVGSASTPQTVGANNTNGPSLVVDSSDIKPGQLACETPFWTNSSLDPETDLNDREIREIENNYRANCDTTIAQIKSFSPETHSHNIKIIASNQRPAEPQNSANSAEKISSLFCPNQVFEYRYQTKEPEPASLLFAEDSTNIGPVGQNNIYSLSQSKINIEHSSYCIDIAKIPALKEDGIQLFEHLPGSYEKSATNAPQGIQTTQSLRGRSIKSNCGRRKSKKQAKESVSGNLLVEQASALSIVSKDISRDEQAKIQSKKASNNKEAAITGSSSFYYQDYLPDLKEQTKGSTNSTASNSNYSYNYTAKDSKQEMQLPHFAANSSSTSFSRGQDSISTVAAGLNNNTPFPLSVEWTNHLYVAHLLAGMSSAQLAQKASTSAFIQQPQEFRYMPTASTVPSLMYNSNVFFNTAQNSFHPLTENSANLNSNFLQAFNATAAHRTTVESTASTGSNSPLDQLNNCFGPVDTLCNNSSDSGASNSDKENNLINVAKMDSSYFSLSTDEYSNQSSSTGAASSSGASNTQMDENHSGDQECDCDKDSLLACTENSNSNDVNSFYDASDDASSQMTDVSTEIDQENEPPRMQTDNEAALSASSIFQIPALMLAAQKSHEYKDMVAAQETSGELTTSCPAVVTDKFLPLDRYPIRDSGSAIVAQYLANQGKPRTASQAYTPEAHLSYASQVGNQNNSKQCQKPALTPDTFAATRQIIADTPITPTADSKFGQDLNENCVGALRCPMPELGWGDSRVCWEDMIADDDVTHRQNRNALENHTKITAQHRAVVLEWLSEVSQSYHLRKDTFYLAANFFDRFLSLTKGIGADKLQLLGTTALFTASKIEEIYPPPTKEFANVTDGACDTLEIIETEVCLVQHLRWKLTPMTSLQWLLLFLQIKNAKYSPGATADIIRSFSVGERTSSNNLLIHSTFDPMLFYRTSMLLDLCTLAYESVQYAPRILAAATLLAFDASFKQLFTCLDQEELKRCYTWARPFAIVAKDLFSKEAEFVISEDKFRSNTMIHLHTANMSALKQAEALQATLSPRKLKANANLFAVPSSQSSSGGDLRVKTSQLDDDEDCSFFSINPADQVNMVLISPPYDE
ncbi:uncharacterized protein LOC134838942 [Symsagittifera roscoffensis]|uniref:uncharacterized protein LOC134838942 n=1 Tax=Symsagittifera roscoffensis TaxID=84072 RepID=UPI00307B642C